jgi:phage shock protein PspC (stress-responsive transcriptional regulator)
MAGFWDGKFSQKHQANKQNVLELNQLHIILRLNNCFMIDKKILGVCAWAAGKLNMDVSVVRIIWALTAIFGAGILAYFIVYLLLEFKLVE